MLCCVQVLYEDEDLLAVNKPINMITAPKHRWLVRCICFGIVVQWLAWSFERHDISC